MKNSFLPSSYILCTPFDVHEKIAWVIVNFELVSPVVVQVTDNVALKAAAKKLPVILAFPGQALSLLPLIMPPGKPKDIREGLPALCEEFIAGELSTLLFVPPIPFPKTGEKTAIMGLEKSALEKVIAPFQSAGISLFAVLPDFLLLPSNTIFHTKEQVWVKTTEHFGFATDPENLSVFLEKTGSHPFQTHHADPHENSFLSFIAAHRLEIVPFCLYQDKSRERLSQLKQVGVGLCVLIAVYSVGFVVNLGVLSYQVKTLSNIIPKETSQSPESLLAALLKEGKTLNNNNFMLETLSKLLPLSSRVNAKIQALDYANQELSIQLEFPNEKSKKKFLAAWKKEISQVITIGKITKINIAYENSDEN